jgi:hypothetical protein
VSPGRLVALESDLEHPAAIATAASAKKNLTL